jgi:diguanylate cyclase (GGDEF)-like protein
VALVSLISIYICSIYNFLLFHSIVELFCIIICTCIFILVWNSREYIDNNFLLFLGISFLFVGIIDILHLLSYKGMGVFTHSGANLPTQLWIVSRYLQSFSFLISFYFIQKKVNEYYVVLVYFFVTSICIFCIFKGFFPDCFIEGDGLTYFKVISEYIISFTYLISIYLLIKNRSQFTTNIYKLLIMSLLLNICSELSFTFYISVFGLSNIIGHLFKILAFYIVYRVILITGIKQPHNILYNELKKASEKLKGYATIDDLTGINNRRQFFHLSDKQMKISIRYKSNISILAIDIDDFKYANDNFGHHFGDVVLRMTVAIIRSGLRESDIFGRLGGDEFAIVLPETDLYSAKIIAERLRSQIEDYIYPGFPKIVTIVNIINSVSL